MSAWLLGSRYYRCGSDCIPVVEDRLAIKDAESVLPVVLTEHDLGGPVPGVEVVQPLQQRLAQPLGPGQLAGDLRLQLHVVASQHLGT